MTSQPLVSDAGLMDAPVDHPHHRADTRPTWLRWARRIVAAALLGLAIGLAIGRRHELAQAVDLLGQMRLQGLAVALALEAASLVAFSALNCDNAGWHGPKGLAVPDGITLAFLPPV